MTSPEVAKGASRDMELTTASCVACVSMTDKKDEPPTIPVRASDDEDVAWGERVEDESPDDLKRLLAEKPPHHSE